MRISFYKYQGTGNDFIIVDDREEQLGSCSSTLVRKLCNRRLGIGADGLILLHNRTGYDFEMIYYNADGSQSFCGNGSRCAVHLAQQLGIIEEKAYFFTTDGAHRAYIKAALIHVEMHDVVEIKQLPGAYWLNTGSPHYVAWVKNLAGLNVDRQGKQIRYSAPFQEKGVNVNFVQRKGNSVLTMRTYERGVEGETLSCGSGATAAALVASLEGMTSPVSINTPGGKLQVGFTNKGAQHFRDIYLAGPVQQVYQGVIDT